jgi:hypothetical protein
VDAAAVIHPRLTERQSGADPTLVLRVSDMRKGYLSPAGKARRQGGSVSPPRGSPVRGEGKISLRVDQPVEGCQVMTHAFFRSVDGDIDDANVDMEFHWYRSSLRRACANSECLRNSSELGGGNVLLLVAKIECVLCCRLGITREHSSFCSIECFRLAWHSHKQLHEKYALLASEDGALPGAAEATMPWKSQLHNMDVFCPKREESWVEIHQEKCVLECTNVTRSLSVARANRSGHSRPLLPGRTRLPQTISDTFFVSNAESFGVQGSPNPARSPSLSTLESSCHVGVPPRRP